MMKMGSKEIRPILGYGSAGAGNRTGRRIARYNGEVQTAQERNRRMEKNARAVSLDESPPKEELMRYIEAGRCWWCDDGRVFEALSQHWVKAHSIDPQWVRDYLGLSTKFSFISDDLKQQFSDWRKLWYDPDNLKSKPGRHKRLTTCFRESQKRKLQAFRQKFSEEAYRDHMHGIGKTARDNWEKYRLEKHSAVRPCVICGKPVVWPLGEKYRRITCSPECDSERRKRAGQKFAAEHRHPKVRICIVCSKEFTAHSKTCSPECAHEQMSRKAQESSHWKLERARKASAEKRLLTPLRLCTIEGCGRPVHCKGLCSLHYQRTRRTGHDHLACLCNPTNVPAQGG